MHHKDLPRLDKLISINEKVVEGLHSVLLKEKSRQERDQKEQASSEMSYEKVSKE